MISKVRFQRTPLFLVLMVALMTYCVADIAEAADPEYFLFEPKNKIEVSASYDYLSPHQTYGDWKNLSLSYYHRANPNLTWFVSANQFLRQEGNGILGSFGAYMDWSNYFYTFTSISSGSNVGYLPKFRLDQDLNFKFGGKQNLVWTVGGSRISYHGDTRDDIWSTGLTAYLDKYVVGYRMFRTSANPGSVISNSHQFVLSYGVDKHEVTTLLYSFGNQAYMTNYLIAPQLVDNDAKTISLTHRQWITRDEGWTAGISRSRIENGYTATGIAIGYFWEY